MQIGEVARQSGVGVQTVRYYERVGILPRAARTPSGYRQFDSDAPRIVHFVKAAQDLGFSLEEIKDLLRLRSQPAAQRDEVRRIARCRLSSIEERLARLNRMRTTLDDLIARCEQASGSIDCPILESLAREHDE